MKKLKEHINTLPTITAGGETHLSYQAVTDTVAAFLYPEGNPIHPTDQIDEAGYQRVLETAAALCHELGYQEVVKLTPPTVALSDMGLYCSAAPSATPDPESIIVHVASRVGEKMSRLESANGECLVDR